MLTDSLATDDNAQRVVFTWPGSETTFHPSRANANDTHTRNRRRKPVPERKLVP